MRPSAIETHSERGTPVVAAPPEGPALLAVEGLAKQFADSSAQAAVAEASFTVGEGELMALLGPSGCGKTTTLRLIGGFERPDRGRIRLAGADITDLPPEKRGIGIVFQDYALFPHLTVADNVMFGLRALSKAARRARATAMLELVALAALAHRMPHQLSGGQQQRVALARTLATAPKLVLLDEPFSNLDAALRHETRREVRAMLRRAGSAVILVTHDQEEAMAFADRMAVMDHGRIRQIGAPDEIYRAPACAFVARFLGQSNIVPGIARGAEAETPIGRLAIDRTCSGRVNLAVRPEQLALAPDAASGAGVITGREFRGHDLLYWIEAGGLRLLAITGPDTLLAVGQRVRLTMPDPAVAVASE